MGELHFRLRTDFGLLGKTALKSPESFKYHVYHISWRLRAQPLNERLDLRSLFAILKNHTLWSPLQSWRLIWHLNLLLENVSDKKKPSKIMVRTQTNWDMYSDSSTYQHYFLGNITIKIKSTNFNFLTGN